MRRTYLLWEPIHLGIETEMQAEMLQEAGGSSFGYRIDTKTGDDIIEVGFDSREECEQAAIEAAARLAVTA